MQNSTSKKAAGSDTKKSRSRQLEKRARAPSSSSSSELDFDDRALYNDRPLEAQSEARKKYEATLARIPRGYGHDSDTDDTKEFKKAAERAKDMKLPEETPSTRKEKAKADAPRAKSSRTSTSSSHRNATPADPLRKEKTPADPSRSERTPARSKANSDNLKAMSSLKLSYTPQDRPDTRKQVPSSSRSGPTSSSNSSTSKSRETRDSAFQRTRSAFKIYPGRHYTLEKYPMNHKDVERRGKTHYVCLVSKRCENLRINILKDMEKHLEDSHYEALGGVREEREKPKAREVAGSDSGKSVGESSNSVGRR